MTMRILTARIQAEMLYPWSREAGYGQNDVSDNLWGGGFYDPDKDKGAVLDRIKEKEDRRKRQQSWDALERNNSPEALQDASANRKRMMDLLTAPLGGAT